MAQRVVILVRETDELADLGSSMIWFYTRGTERRTCETRLASEGSGYELVVTDADGVHVEEFADLARLLAREHELLAAWRALGWREARPDSPRSGLRAPKR